MSSYDSAGNLLVNVAVGGGGGGGSGGSVNVADPTTPANKLAVDAAGKIGINNLPATQPVSATALPLPTGAAQEGGNLATVVTNTGNIFTRLANIVTMAFDSVSRLQVSLYGKNAAAGDTPVLVDSAGRVITAQQASTATLYTLASQTTSTNADSGSLDVTKYRETLVLCNITAATGTTPTIQFFVESLGSDGIWYAIYSSSTINGVATVVKSIGSGQSSATSLGNTIRLRWAITGTTPSFTFSASIIAK